MSESEKWRPGDYAPTAGLYVVVNRDGSRSEVIYRIRKKGTILPPTFKKGQWFEKF